MYLFCRRFHYITLVFLHLDVDLRDPFDVPLHLDTSCRVNAVKIALPRLVSMELGWIGLVDALPGLNGNDVDPTLYEM